jgi:hypothetical protein
MRFIVTVAWPILITFAISGLWHGASWSFVMFGVSIALLLVVNHLWRLAQLPAPPRIVSWLLTMVGMCIAFVYFRSGTLEVANDYLLRMVDPSGFVLPPWLAGVGALLGAPIQPLLLFPSGTVTLHFAIGLLVLGILSLGLPDPASGPDKVKLNWTTAVGTAFVALLALGQLDQPQTFIYFQF